MTAHMRILELSVRVFGCYQALVSLCGRGYFSPDIMETLSGRVVLDE